MIMHVQIGSASSWRRDLLQTDPADLPDPDYPATPIAICSDGEASSASTFVRRSVAATLSSLGCMFASCCRLCEPAAVVVIAAPRHAAVAPLATPHGIDHAASKHAVVCLRHLMSSEAQPEYSQRAAKCLNNLDALLQA